MVWDVRDGGVAWSQYLGTKKCCGRARKFLVSQSYWSRKRQAGTGAKHSHELIAGSQALDEGSEARHMLEMTCRRKPQRRNVRASTARISHAESLRAPSHATTLALRDTTTTTSSARDRSAATTAISYNARFRPRWRHRPSPQQQGLRKQHRQPLQSGAWELVACCLPSI
jgi:hypothetical protein